MEARPTLIGERVVIRPGRQDDVDPLLAIAHEPDVLHWWGEPYTREELAGELLGELEPEAAYLVIEVDGAVAGSVHVHEELDAEFRHAGIDIYLGAAWHGRGLGSEAVELTVRHLFELGHHRITIDPAAENERAVRCYAKAGFQPVGVMRAYQHLRGRWRDGLLMELIREDLLTG